MAKTIRVFSVIRIWILPGICLILLCAGIWGVVCEAKAEGQTAETASQPAALKLADADAIAEPAMRQAILSGKGWQGLVPANAGTRGSILVEKVRTSLPSPSEPNNTVQVQARLDYQVAHGVVCESIVIVHTNAIEMENSAKAVDALREFLVSRGKGGRRYNVNERMVELAGDPRASGFIQERILADNRIWLHIETSAAIDMTGDELSSQYCSGTIRRLPDPENKEEPNGPAASRPGATTLDVGRVRLFTDVPVGHVMEHLARTKETYEASLSSPGKVALSKDVVLRITSRKFVFT